MSGEEKKSVDGVDQVDEVKRLREELRSARSDYAALRRLYQQQTAFRSQAMLVRDEAREEVTALKLLVVKLRAVIDAPGLEGLVEADAEMARLGVTYKSPWIDERGNIRREPLEVAEEEAPGVMPYPVMTCPQCGAEETDLDGFGMQYCSKCGYCTHLAVTGDVCDACGKRLVWVEDAKEESDGSVGWD